jgi:hypothetical protein
VKDDCYRERGDCITKNLNTAHLLNRFRKPWYCSVWCSDQPATKQWEICIPIHRSPAGQYPSSSWSIADTAVSQFWAQHSSISITESTNHIYRTDNHSFRILPCNSFVSTGSKPWKIWSTMCTMHEGFVHKTAYMRRPNSPW